MQTPKRIVPYPLRLDDSIRKAVKEEAHRNRRSLNAELVVLIEEALLSRKEGRPRA
ncbi:MAG: Arc family DNA-binding protein [Pseudomonas sp.]|uniref:Arc family DNA-binding protein n=1 Tax=Pseudomonas sp. TaxID=306 RepID=UPI003BB4EAA1